MDQIESLSDDVTLRHRCQRILGQNGRLTTAIADFVSRESQLQLALAIADAIDNKRVLIAEAGTGTGKTFAYLVPALLSGKKTVISTATKTLQDQLFHKDLPLLLRALGISSRIQNLKGRANYLCRYRIERHAEEGRFMTPECVHDVLYVREKLPQLQVGERGELPEIKEESQAWPYVTSTSDNCLGNECPHYQTCFLVQARKKALDAQVVVINHHLYFADSQLKEDGFGELLPGVDVVVFDEAHQLADIAAHFHGARVGTRQLRDALDDTLREWPVLDLANQPLKTLSVTLDDALGALISMPQEERVGWEALMVHPSFGKNWQDLLSVCDDIRHCFSDESVAENKGLLRCKERWDELITVLRSFTAEKITAIRWVERFKHHVVFHATPFDVSSLFVTRLQRQTAAYVFTSATLTMAQSFDCFTKPLGLSDATTLLLPSPFDFEQQALLYLPRTLPDPKDKSYYERLLTKALPIIEACGGRCFFLFTSHRALKEVASLLTYRLKVPLLIQGEEAKPILLARFRQLGNAVLLGTGTFWEGVDVKGEALSCVIIDKLPFASPADPVTRGRLSYLTARGLSGFDELSLPNAVLALKQGVGRLIRDVSDKGVLMIADPRLTAREYGQRIFDSLPPMRKTRDEQTVLSFINQLALIHEPISS